MDNTDFNGQINELQRERVLLERRLQHVKDSITALLAMRRSAEAVETPMSDEMFGG